MADAALRRRARAPAYENPRPDIQQLVPAGARRVLDVGCASGALGEALKARQGAEVVGIELDAGYAARAAQRLDRVVEADAAELLGREDAVSELGRFDCVVAGDVLEHLADPWAAMRGVAALLEPEGAAVISVPNVRFWATFWWVGVHGIWPRWDEGLFDADHLRWFTLQDALALLHQAGLREQRISRQYRWRYTPSRRWDRYAALLDRTPLRPFFAYQYVIAGRPA